MVAMQLYTDCEGPLALNDHPFELCREFLKPRGDRLFRQVSRYDEYLANIAKPKDHQAGDALKLIPPFLKARGLSNDLMRKFAARSLMLAPGAEETYRFLHRFDFPSFAVSANYRQFAEAVGSRLGFKSERIFGAELDLDQYRLAKSEAEALARLEEEIVATPDLEAPPGAGSLADLAEPAQEAVAVLDRIFRERLPEMGIGVMLQEVNPLGGPGKAKAVSDGLAQTGLKLADTIYAGNDRSDVQAFEAVRAGGGLAISFNGDRHAVQAAEVVVVSDCAWPMALLTAIFRLWGKDGVLEVAAPETRAKSRALVLPEAMIEPIAMGLQGHVFNLYMSDNPNREKIIKESEAMAARLRGEAIAGNSEQ